MAILLTCSCSWIVLSTGARSLVYSTCTVYSKVASIGRATRQDSFRKTRALAPLTPNKFELIPVLEARLPRGGPVQDPVVIRCSLVHTLETTRREKVSVWMPEQNPRHLDMYTALHMSSVQGYLAHKHQPPPRATLGP